jgi:hypothetical protein
MVARIHGKEQRCHDPHSFISAEFLAEEKN